MFRGFEFNLTRPIPSSIQRPVQVNSQNILFTVLALLAIILIKYISKSRHPQIDSKICTLPYCLPIIGHAIIFCTSNPARFVTWARNICPDGIFIFKIGAKTFNVATNTQLICRILNENKSALSIRPVVWNVVHRLFGVPTLCKGKYFENWETLESHHEYLVREPFVNSILAKFSQFLEENVPQMITFLDNDVDLQPWERWANPEYISDTETQISLMPLLYMMMGSASVTSIFGAALLEKHPKLIQNLYEMEKGSKFLLMGTPAWFPWSTSTKAHVARYKILSSLKDYYVALNNKINRITNEAVWSNLDDVSDFVIVRNRFFNGKNFTAEERCDIEIMWNLTVNPSMLIFWQIIFIYSTPGLVERIRKESAPYASMVQGVTIGRISEVPRLSVSPSTLFKECPLLVSTFLETRRLVNHSWSIHAVERDFQITCEGLASSNTVFSLKKGQYLAYLQNLLTEDSDHLIDPEKFIPERFIPLKNCEILTIGLESTHSCGSGGTDYRAGELVAKACITFVASVIACWDLNPIDEASGLVIPEQLMSLGVSKPGRDVRVRIKRKF